MEGVERLDAYVGRYLPQMALSALVPLLIGAGERLFEFADTKPRITYPNDPLPLEDHTLAFDRIGFRYREDEPSVLEKISFKVEPGKLVAVVGPSDAGKSTLANLALRFWDPTEGTVRLGSHDLRNYAQEDL